MDLDDSQRVFLSSKRPATSHCFDYAKRSLLAAELEINRVWVERQLSSDLAEKALVFNTFLLISIFTLSHCAISTDIWKKS